MAYSLHIFRYFNVFFNEHFHIRFLKRDSLLISHISFVSGKYLTIGLCTNQNGDFRVSDF